MSEAHLSLIDSVTDRLRTMEEEFQYDYGADIQLSLVKCESYGHSFTEILVHGKKAKRVCADIVAMFNNGEIEKDIPTKMGSRVMCLVTFKGW